MARENNKAIKQVLLEYSRLRVVPHFLQGKYSEGSMRVWVSFLSSLRVPLPRGWQFSRSLSYSAYSFIPKESEGLPVPLEYIPVKRVTFLAREQFSSTLEYSFASIPWKIREYWQLVPPWETAHLPSPKPTFYPKWEVSVNVGLGEG